MDADFNGKHVLRCFIYFVIWIVIFTFFFFFKSKFDYYQDGKTAADINSPHDLGND